MACLKLTSVDKCSCNTNLRLRLETKWRPLSKPSVHNHRRFQYIRVCIPNHLTGVPVILDIWLRAIESTVNG